MADVALRINDMIQESSGRKEEILRRLKKLNRQALEEYFLAPGYIFGHTFKMKYKALQNSKIWSEARDLIVELRFLENNLDYLKCEKCGRVLSSFIMHHDEYRNEEIFTPDFVSLIGSRCHALEHPDKAFNHE